MQKMKKTYLICTDLDRTLLPNGREPHSPEAMQAFKRLALRSEIKLAYVSGRSETLLREAITDFEIPLPDFAVGDVGTSIYSPGDNWRYWADWSEEIAIDWQGKKWADIRDMVDDVVSLELQEDDRQNSYKLSYYTDTDVDVSQLRAEIEKRLKSGDVRASIIFSIDEEKSVGLLDILPERATKVHAIHFLMEKGGFPPDCTVFAGDSGNDLQALTSGLNAVLVKNASENVRREALAVMKKKKMLSRLYLAQGQFLGLNGNYCGGVLEGVAHFLPETKKWMVSPE